MKPRELRFCSSCGARIIWAKTVNDRLMPVDADPIEYGNLLLSTDDPPIARVSVGGDRLSHFATCPEASTHRKSRRRSP